MDGSYNAEWFAEQIGGSQRSAEIIVPLILERLPNIRSVVDVGCGAGTWLAEFRRMGVTDVLGFDGNPPNEMLRIPVDQFQRVDLGTPLPIERRFDLAICLEVGEHLPQERARSLVEDLCRLADRVVFSAAIPHQGGTNHVNEQWQSYWAALFLAQGLACEDSLRPLVWTDRRIEVWYRQNMLVFQRKPESTIPAMLDCVHPELFTGHLSVRPLPLWWRILRALIPPPIRAWSRRFRVSKPLPRS